jgi:hypothetical protein
MGLTKALYRKDYIVNRTAERLLKEAVKETETNVYVKYDLFPITDYLATQINPCILERYGLGTTKEIMKAIEFLKETRNL